MIWDVLFWLALAFLALVVISKLIWPMIAGRKDKGSGQKAVWIGAAIAVVVFAVSFYMRGESGSATPEWNAQELTQVESLIAALDYYEQAQNLTTGRVPTADDWQTVAALLEAGVEQGEFVGETVLEKVHPRLPEHFRDEFLAGMVTGSHALTEYNQGTVKPFIRDTAQTPYKDSLAVGTELLTRWNLWYDARKDTIRQRLSQK